MTEEMYVTLAEVSDWLVPDDLLEPEASVAMFVDVISTLITDADAAEEKTTEFEKAGVRVIKV